MSVPIDLPGGEVYIYFEEGGLSENDSPAAPEGLAVQARRPTRAASLSRS